MPANAEWLLRVPEILAELRALDVPVLDRAAIQRLFGFQRRRAIQLMHELNGYQAGHSFLVDRLSLIARLEALQKGDRFHQESRRRMRLEESVERMRRHAVAARVKIPVEPAVLDTRIHALPAGIRLAPGSLSVAFRDPQELLQRLFALSQAMANDLGVATLGRRSSGRDEGAAGLSRYERTSSDQSPRSSRWL